MKTVTIQEKLEAQYENQIIMGEEIVRLQCLRDNLLEACLCAVAALSQNKTYPADIALAKQALSDAIQKAKGE